MLVPEYLPREAYQYQTSAPQVIIVEHSHRRHNRLHKHSRSHSNLQSSYSRSESIVLPQPITYSNSQPTYTQSPTVAYPQIEYQSNSHHHNRHSDPNASYGYVVPRSSRPSYPAAAPAHHNSDGRFLYSKCTGRKKALCVSGQYLLLTLPRNDWFRLESIIMASLMSFGVVSMMPATSASF
jgi:hypothetical protein